MDISRIELAKISTRVKGTGDFIKVEQEKCNGCGKCTIICIMTLWKMREGKASISKDYQNNCLECGACFQVCDMDAIDFSYPKGGTGVVYLNG